MCSVGTELLEKNVLRRYMSLPQPCNQIQATYVWIDGSGQTMRCKTRTMDSVPSRPADCVVWSFDGWSTGQADPNCSNSDVLLYPCALFNDPFRRGQNKIVLCETYVNPKKPSATNHRASCRKVMEQLRDHRPWFGMEQEFSLFCGDGRPFAGPRMCTSDESASTTYCGVGTSVGLGRDLLESHYRACIYAGVKIAGMHSETNPSQWLFQIGPCEGIEIGDNLWMARFILERIAEDYGLIVSFEPKANPGNFTENKLLTNFSTLKMRQEGGIRDLEKTIEKLRASQPKQLPYYDPKFKETDHKTAPASGGGGGGGGGSVGGSGSVGGGAGGGGAGSSCAGSTTREAPAGAGGTEGGSHCAGSATRVAGGSKQGGVGGTSPGEFTHGIGNRHASIRIPLLVSEDGRGHLQDRRPLANADPYKVAEYLVRATCACPGASRSASPHPSPS